MKMKKLLAAILILALTFTMAACGGNTGNESSGGNSSESVIPSEMPSGESASDSEETSDEGETSVDGEAPEGEAKALIAYFSWSGNTEQLAGIIHDETGGDLFEITTATAYTQDYDALLDQAQQEQRENARPELTGQVENWEDYDVVFIGYPNWWSDAPMAVLSFLEAYDFTGKTVVPFCTHGGGGFGRSLESIENSASGAAVAEGFEINGSSAGDAGSDVVEWISALNLGE